jgi:MFS family permease
VRRSRVENLLVPVPTESPTSPSKFAALENPAFVKYWFSRIAGSFAAQIQTVAVGWQVYDITRDPLDLGFVGLSQFLPALLLVLVTGAVADRYRRRTVMAVCLFAETGCAAALLAFTLAGGRAVAVIFIILAAFGTARAFFGPAQQSLLPNLVPPQHLASAIAANTSAWQLATICGPVVGGLLYGVSPVAAYAAAAVLLAAAAIVVLFIPRPTQRTTPEPPSFERLVAGIRYIWREKLVLGAISLDLFAVLFAGATALLPVYARDILAVGPWGLGLLRAAPGIGAIAVALYLTFHPLRDHAGIIMLAFVALFGAATALFGVSTSTTLSVAALIAVGGADMVSVYVRETLIQLWTPDQVRGRVNAVNNVFVGASNELGELRAGVSAAIIGTVAAVTLGGIATMAIAALWFRLFPELARARSLAGRT